MHTINTILKLSKTTAALITMVPVASAAIVLRYQEPVSIERICEESPPLLINNFNSCGHIDQTLSSLEAQGYNSRKLRKKQWPSAEKNFLKNI